MLLEGVFIDSRIAALLGIALAAVIVVLWRRMHTQQALMHALGQSLNEITAETDLPRLLETITSRAASLLRASGGELSTYDTQTHNLQVLASIGVDEQRTTRVGRRFPISPSFLVSNPEGANPRSSELVTYLEGLTDLSALVLPLLANQAPVGVLTIFDNRPNRRFRSADSRKLRWFAQQAVLALTNDRLLRQAQTEAAEAETLRQAGAAVAASLQPDETTNLILDQLARVVPFDSAAVHVIVGSETEIITGRGFSEQTPVVGLRLPLDDTNPATEVVRLAQPRCLPDVQKTHAPFRREPHNHIRSWLGVPMIFQSRVIGLISLDSRTPGRFTERHARLVSAFADQVAIALENVRLYQRAVQSAEKLTTLYQAGQAIAGSLNQQDVYQAVRGAVGRLMPSNGLLLGLVSDARGKDAEGGPQAASIYDINPAYNFVPVRHDLPANGLTKRLLSGEAVRMGTPDPAVFNLVPTVPSNGYNSLLAVPLRHGGKVTGVLGAYCKQEDAYSADDQRMLELLAAQAAIALENARLFGEVQEMAFTDPLTGLYNRRHFMNLAAGEFQRSQRYTRPLAVLMADLDHLKQVNDTHGHQVGDMVLRALADTFQKALRTVDVVARYGGEEFVMLLPETDARQGREVAERLRRQVEETRVQTPDGPLSVTVSIGLAVYVPQCPTLETLVEWADRALYRAKARGRNRVEQYNMGDTMPLRLG